MGAYRSRLDITQSRIAPPTIKVVANNLPFPSPHSMTCIVIACHLGAFLALP